MLILLPPINNWTVDWVAEVSMPPFQHMNDIYRIKNITVPDIVNNSYSLNLQLHEQQIKYTFLTWSIRNIWVLTLSTVRVNFVRKSSSYDVLQSHDGQKQCVFRNLLHKRTVIFCVFNRNSSERTDWFFEWLVQDHR